MSWIRICPERIAHSFYLTFNELQIDQAMLDQFKLTEGSIPSFYFSEKGPPTADAFWACMLPGRNLGASTERQYAASNSG